MRSSDISIPLPVSRVYRASTQNLARDLYSDPETLVFPWISLYRLRSSIRSSNVLYLPRSSLLPSLTPRFMLHWNYEHTEGREYSHINMLASPKNTEYRHGDCALYHRNHCLCSSISIKRRSNVHVKPIDLSNIYNQILSKMLHLRRIKKCVG